MSGADDAASHGAAARKAVRIKTKFWRFVTGKVFESEAWGPALRSWRRCGHGDGFERTGESWDKR